MESNARNLRTMKNQKVELKRSKYKIFVEIVERKCKFNLHTDEELYHSCGQRSSRRSTGSYGSKKNITWWNEEVKVALKKKK